MQGPVSDRPLPRDSRAGLRARPFRSIIRAPMTAKSAHAHEGTVAVVLLAAGSGTRLGRGVPKALVELDGEPLVRRAARALAAVPGVVRLVLVVPPGPEGDDVVRALGPLGTLETVSVAGGARRRDSVRAGLAAAGAVSHVLVHDAARALVTTGLAALVLDAAQRAGAAIPAVRVPDTLVRDAGGFLGDEVPRAGVHAVQTPQGFRLDLLVAAHDAADPAWDAPDDGTLARAHGVDVALVPGDPDNVKITWESDLPRALAILGRRPAATTPADAEPCPAPDPAPRPAEEATMRIGIGWDVHPFVPHRRTVLAGVVAEEAFGPAGHSDGDPLCHALCDALLGAAALGDIGTLFPDTDPRWKGAPGLELLQRTVEHLRENGFAPAQVDAVVICDAPKIGPHRDEIRANLAAVLELAPGDVSVKGKRTEGLGGLAGGKGIACHAVARLVAGGTAGA